MKAQSRKKTQLLKELESNPSVERACRKIGIARSTYYRWIESDPHFKEIAMIAQDRGREKISDFGESKLMENMSNNHFPSIAYWLGHNTSRYRSYPKEVYESELKELRRHKRDYEMLIAMLQSEHGYGAIIQYIKNSPDPRDYRSPLEKS